MIASYKDLEVYQEAYKLAIEVHKKSMTYPGYERYEIGSQIRRAAESIPMNIAEGYAKKESAAEFKRFLSMAAGSVNEIEVLLDMSKDLGYLNQEQHEAIKSRYEVLGKRINKLKNQWQQKESDI